jgi:hypothetical protein
VVDEAALAKIDALVMELTADGVTDFVMACANSDGMLGFRMNGSPQQMVYLANALLFQIMNSSLYDDEEEVVDSGRENYGE